MIPLHNIFFFIGFCVVAHYMKSIIRLDIVLAYIRLLWLFFTALCNMCDSQDSAVL